MVNTAYNMYENAKVCIETSKKNIFSSTFLSQLNELKAADTTSQLQVYYFDVASITLHFIGGEKLIT